MTFKQLCLFMGFASLAAAAFNTSEDVWIRIGWFIHGVMFIVAFDAIKDVEKAKRKERDMTEIRMKQTWLDDAQASEDARDERYANVITETSGTLLKQIATYVRTGTPDRTCGHCEKEKE